MQTIQGRWARHVPVGRVKCDLLILPEDSLEKVERTSTVL